MGVFEPDPQARAHAEGQRAYAGLRFFDRAEDLLGQPGLVAVAIEGLNAHSPPMALEAVKAGKHIWYDKPAGDDWEAFQEVVSIARRQSLVVQMGYMLRYQDGFQRLAEWSGRGSRGTSSPCGPTCPTGSRADRPARRLHPQSRRAQRGASCSTWGDTCSTRCFGCSRTSALRG